MQAAGALMQNHHIALSLKEIAAANPMLAAINAVGFVGGLHYGTDAARGGIRPFGLLSVVEVDRLHNTSGVDLVTYEVTLTIVAEMLVGKVGAILAAFHAYWDRINTLPQMATDRDRLVMIHSLANSEIGEADNRDLGKDVILGTTGWTLQISEHTTALTE